jgi:hypothetical protein
MTWINVFDEMPENNNEIMFLELVHNQYVHHGYYDGQWHSMTNKMNIKDSRVTHWMRIPALPTVDECWAVREELMESDKD